MTNIFIFYAIAGIVSKALKTNIRRMSLSKPDRDSAEAKMVVSAICYHEYDMHPAQIAAFWNIERTTVLYHIKRIEESIKLIVPNPLADKYEKAYDEYYSKIAA